MCQRRTAAVAAALATSLPALVGCQQQTSQARVIDQWSQRMDAMGLLPIIPAQEDVKVGDLYVYGKDFSQARTLEERRQAARLFVSTTRWNTLPVLEQLGREYRERRSWPRTPDVFLRSVDPGGEKSWAEAVSDGAIFDDQEVPTRLRIVNLESLTAVSFTAGDLEAVIPTEVSPLIRGVADSRSVAVSFRVGGAESYALSLEGTLSLLTEPGGEGATGKRVKQPYRDNLTFMASPQGRVWMTVITEVVYFRSADISVRPVDGNPQDDKVSVQELAEVSTMVSGTTTASAAAAPPAEPGPAEDAEAAGGAASGSSGGALSGDGSTLTLAVAALDPIYAAFVRAKAINEVLLDTDADDAPGGQIRFLSVTDEAVSIRRVWPRGLAIGVRGLCLEIDAASGDIHGSRPLMWPSSVATQSSS